METDNGTIGARLRDLRLKNGLTQEELADRAELTKGYISQLENDLTSPSIATLIDILTLLGSSLADFFAGGEKSQLVFTDSDYFEKEYDDEKITWIVPTAQKNEMEPVLVELETGGETDADIPHEGEEFGYVLEGRLQISVGDSVSVAGKGDSFYYSADKKHCIKNIAEGKSRFLWVSCPPSF